MHVRMCRGEPAASSRHLQARHGTGEDETNQRPRRGWRAVTGNRYCCRPISRQRTRHRGVRKARRVCGALPAAARSENPFTTSSSR